MTNVDFSGVQGNESALSTASGAFKGWTADRVYAAMYEVKVGASKNGGSLVSPVLAGQGKVTLRFTARTYKTDETTIWAGVSPDGGTTWAEAAVTPGTETQEFEVTMPGGAGSRARWRAAAGQRFYLSAIQIETKAAADPDLRMRDEAGFPVTPVGGASTQRVVVANGGARSNLTIRSWSAAGGDTEMFEVGSPGALPLRLGPGESAEVEAVYRPTATGWHEVRWVMVSDDPEEARHEIAFWGRTPGGALGVSNIQWTASVGGASPFAGREVTVRGIVTYVEPDGFGISDAGGGPWSGVYAAETAVVPRLGEEVVFDATVEESGGETRLTGVEGLSVLGRGKDVEPTEVGASELGAERWEGVRVRVKGATVRNGNVGGKGTHWQARDGTGRDFYVVSKVPLRHCWKTGEVFEAVCGMVTGINGTNGVSPRDDRDLEGREVWDYVLRGTVVAEEGVLRDGWVWVRDDRIEYVGSEAPAGAGRLVDLRDRGAIIFPGLVDAHNHAAYNSFPTLMFDAYPFGHRDQWGEESAEYSDWKKVRTGLRTAIGDSQKDLTAKYGECLELMAGCVMIQGESNGDVEHSHPAVLLRNVEHFPYRTDHDIFPWDSTASERSVWKRRLDGGGLDALMIHLCEGTDSVARAQFDLWESWGMLTNGVTIIHGSALGPEEFGKMAAAGVKLVWSPMSNMRLYAGTADVRAAKEAGVVIGLSPDWTPSGCYNILEELGCAWTLNCTVLSNLFTDKELCDMVTANTAACSGIGDTHGAIAAGRNAGLAVIEGDPDDPYLSLIAARPKQVILTVVDGTPRYGDADVMEELGAGDGSDEVLLRGRRKRFNIAVEHPYLEHGGMRFVEMLEELRGGHEGLATTGELDREELQLLSPELLQGDGDDVEPFRSDSPLASAPSASVEWDTGDRLTLRFRHQDFWDNATFTEDLRHTIDIVPAAHPQYSIQTIAEGLENRKENESVTFSVACLDMHTNYLFRFTTEDGAGNRRVATTTNGFRLAIHQGGDTDGDGIPNEWEIDRFGGFDAADARGDEDGDGWTNLQEYTADTNPRDGASGFGEVAPVGAGKVRLSGWTSPNRRYELWRTESLTEPDWQVVGEGRPGTGEADGLVFEVPEGSGFYRAGVKVGEQR